VPFLLSIVVPYVVMLSIVILNVVTVTVVVLKVVESSVSSSTSTSNTVSMLFIECNVAKTISADNDSVGETMFALPLLRLKIITDAGALKHFTAVSYN
jgi:hypothetical protein